MRSSFSALDAYFRVPASPVLFIRHPGGLVDLARESESLGFSGLPYADASDESAEPRIRFQCAEGEYGAAFLQTRLLHDPDRRYFDARGGVYASLAERAPRPRQAPPELALFEAAVLASRYPFAPERESGVILPRDLPAAFQRDLLDLILTGTAPDKGLETLRSSGFLDAYWPEIASLAGVAHAKDYHPEGDAWRHTLETFSHRKHPDHILSLALLLHDAGKPDAVAVGARRFDRHSEIGERTARTFLQRLGYPRGVVEDVCFLVRYHMLPSALPRLPPSSVEHTLRNPLFPALLELYRCDELSTFKGPDGYYEACSAYRAYLKNARNPYRGPDGKKRANARTE